MTGAGLPPIAIEAVLKLLAIGQESAKTRKKVKAAKPNLRLELTPATASSELPLTTRTATRTIAQRRRPVARKPVPAKADAEGAETC